jgi:hypothetical protein
MATPGYTANPLPDGAPSTTATRKRRGKLSLEKRLKRYQHDVAVAQKEMKPIHADWKRAIDFYEGEQWKTKKGVDMESADSVVINHVASIINTVLPAITTEPPRLRAVAMRPDGEDVAPVVEALMNYEAMRLRLRDELAIGTLDMLIMGPAVWKVGYEFSSDEVPRDENEIELEFQQMMAKFQAQSMGLPDAGAPGAGALAPDPNAPIGPDQALGGPPEAGGMGGPQSPPDQYGQGYGPGLSPNPGFGPDFGSVPKPEAAPQGAPLDPTLFGAPAGAGPQQQPQEAATAAMLGQQQAAAPQPLPDEAPPPPPSTAPIPTEEEVRAMIPTSETVIVKDDIFVERVDPFEVYIDPEARSLKEARWVAQRIVRPLEDVQSDGRYSNTKNLKVTTEVDEARKTTGDPMSEELGDYTKRVAIWEYYNIKDRSLCVFVENHDKFLYEGSYSYPFDGPPFVFAMDYNTPNKFWGWGEVRMIEGAQVELNKIRTQQLVHNKRFNRKILYREEAFGPKGIAALQSDQDGIIIPVNPGQNLAEVLQPIPDQGMPADRYQMSQVVEADLTQLSGVSDYQRGSFLPRHVTASEANLMQGAQDLRARDKLDRIEGAATEIGRMILKLAQTFYDNPRWMLISGNGMTVPVQFTKEDIEGEFQITVDASSTQPTNEQFAQQQAERLYQLMRPDPMVRPEELIKKILQAYGIVAPDRFIITPEEQMLQQLTGQQGGGQPGAPGQQPGQEAGPAPQGSDLTNAVAGGQEAAMGG